MKKTTIEKNAKIIKEKLLNSPPGLLLNFKWRTSRGNNTCGYNICSCYIDDYKVGASMGGGYDMQGDSFSQFLNNAFSEELLQLYKKKKDGNFYGLIYYKNDEREEAYCDGACGLDCMIRIINALGFKTDYKWNKRDGAMYYIYKDLEGKEVYRG